MYDFYVLVYRQKFVVPLEHGFVKKSDESLFPVLKERWHLFSQLYDYHNMELLDVLTVYDETCMLTLDELRQRVKSKKH